MARFIICDDTSGENVAVDARNIDEAIEEYVREHGEEWSDHVEVRARADGARQWLVFLVTQHTEIVVDVGDPTPGAMVDEGKGAPDV